MREEAAQRAVGSCAVELSGACCPAAAWLAVLLLLPLLRQGLGQALQGQRALEGLVLEALAALQAQQRRAQARQAARLWGSSVPALPVCPAWPPAWPAPA